MADLRRAQTIEGWDPVADGYATLIDPDLAHYGEHALELVPVGEGDRVLDVACGAGALTMRAAERGANVLAVDFAPRFVSIVEARAEQRGLASVEARVMDGQNLDLDDGTFDAAFSMFGLMLFPDRESGFSELHRVVAPGGQAVVSSWADPSRIEWFTLFAQAVQTALPDLDPPPPPFIDLTDPSRLRKEMEDGGFQDVEVHTLETHTVSQDAGSEWRKLAEANPVVPGLLENLGREPVDEIQDAFHRVYEERYGEGPVDLASPAHVAVGRRG